MKNLFLSVVVIISSWFGIHNQISSTQTTQVSLTQHTIQTASIDFDSLTTDAGFPTLTGKAANVNELELCVVGADCTKPISVSDDRWSGVLIDALKAGTYIVQVYANDDGSLRLLDSETLVVLNSVSDIDLSNPLSSLQQIYPDVIWVATTTTINNEAMYYKALGNTFGDDKTYTPTGKQWGAEFTVDSGASSSSMYPLSYNDVEDILQKNGWNCGYDGQSGLVNADGYMFNSIVADGVLGGISGCMKMVGGNIYEVVISTDSGYTSDGDPDGPVDPICPCPVSVSIFVSDPIQASNVISAGNQSKTGI